MKAMKKLLALTLALAMVFSLAVTPAFAADEGYSDVPENEWYADAVAYATANGLMDGVGGGKFNPDGISNRAMVVTILHRMEGTPKPAAAATFSDLTDIKGDWHLDAVAWASENGIVEGVGNGKFAPAKSITREQLATMMYRYAVTFKGCDGSVVGDLKDFPDADKVSSWAKDAMAWAVGTGLITGTKNGDVVTLNPQGSTPRKQLATVLMRLDANVVAEGTVYNPIEINAAGDLYALEAEAASEAYYAVSSRLNGMVLTVVDEEGVTVTVNGKEVKGSVELTGTPVNKVVVKNTTDKAVSLVATIEPALGTDTNPIVIAKAGDLSLEVAAKGETYYAVNGTLSGLALNFDEVEGVTVTVNGVAAESGVILAGAPTIKVVVKNTTDKAVTVAANIADPVGSANNPIVINSASELGGVEAAAKSSTYYAISANLNGMILTVVETEGLTVTVNGTAIEGSVELTGTPVNKVVVTNTTDKDLAAVAEINYPLGTENNPYVIETMYDMTGIEVAAGSSAYYAISSGLNGLYLYIPYISDVSITLNDNYFYESAVLDGSPVNVLVVTNESTEDVATGAEINYRKGDVNNPYLINSADDMYYAAAAAGTETYYMISASLNDNYLNLAEVDGVTFNLNGTVLSGAVAGQYSAILMGVPTNRLVVTSTLEWDEYVMASIGAKAGSTEESAITIQSDPTEGITVPLAAEGVIYLQARVGGMNLTVKNAEGVTVTIDGVEYTADDEGVISVSIPVSMNPYMSNIISVSAENEGEYVLEFAYPEGTQNNPKTVTELQNLNITLADGQDGYYYGWTAPKAGVLKVTVGEVEVAEGVEYDVVVMNNNTYEQRTLIWDAKDGVITMEVNEGDEIVISASAYVWGMLGVTYPGGTFAISGEFVPTPAE